LAISSALSQRAGVRVLIQLGAIFAILAVGARWILDLALGLPTSRRTTSSSPRRRVPARNP
jgi:hypothetical protein